MTDFQYHLITDRKLYQASLEAMARSSEESGVDFFQLREKDMKPGELLETARRLRPILRRTRLIINGSLDVAVTSGADGVHLQKDNLPVAAVRAHYPGLLIGYSAHSREELLAAEGDGASYAFLSPIFEPISKSHPLTPIGAPRFGALIRGVGIPVFALGGITSENISLVCQTGCAGAAGISLFIEQGRFSPKGMVS